MVTLVIISIRKGHWVMFILGIFLPLFWIIGALMPPKQPDYALGGRRVAAFRPLGGGR